MMINSFDNYLKQGRVKRKTPDSEEAKALLKQAEERLDFLKSKMIDNKTAKFMLEGSYEAIREAAQSLMSIKGYKPYLHEAAISFIREHHGDEFSEEEINKFDHFRRLRNDSVYRAVKIIKKDAESSFRFAKRFVKKIKSTIKNQKP